MASTSSVIIRRSTTGLLIPPGLESGSRSSTSNPEANPWMESLDHVPYDGKLPLLGEWDASWLPYFTKLMRLLYDHGIRANGHWKEVDDVMQIMFSKLIPRLLGRLEGNIQPCLIHGDLWEQYISTEVNSNEIYIIDAMAYFAHRKKEIGIWRCDHHQMNERRNLRTGTCCTRCNPNLCTLVICLEQP